MKVMKETYIVLGRVKEIIGDSDLFRFLPYKINEIAS